MKNRTKILIASLFAGLSLGVLSGVKFATKSNKILETQAVSGTTYWKKVTQLSDIADNDEVIIGGVYGDYFYYSSSVSDDPDLKTSTVAKSSYITLSDKSTWYKTTATFTPLKVVLGTRSDEAYLKNTKGYYLKYNSSYLRRGTDWNYGKNDIYIYNVKIASSTDNNCFCSFYYDRPSSNNSYWSLDFKLQNNNKNIYITNQTSGYTTMYMYKKVNTSSAITFDNNGGSGGAISSKSYSMSTSSQTVKVSTAPTKTGYYVSSYTVSRSGTTAGNIPTVNNSTITIPANSYGAFTIKANWTANKYKVTFDMANGSGGTASIDATYNSSMPSITLPTRAGYVFGGYYTGENGTGTQYYDSTGASMQKYSLTSGITLYAKWTPNTYHVSLDSQGGFEGSTVVDTVFDQPVPAVTAPTKLGHIFKGYYSELNGAGIQYINGDGSSTGIAWTTASDNTIYGYWEPIKINITIIVNDATDPGTTSTSAYYGSEMPYITPATRTGYKLLGYFDAQEGGTLIYSAEGYGHGACELLEDITIYAQWEKIVNTITFDQRGGDGGTTSMVVSYNETVQNVTLPTKQYFTFKGYYAYPNAEGTQYFFEDGAPVNSTWGSTSDVTVYAYWIKTLNNFAREFLDLTGSYCSGDKTFINTLKNSFNMLSDSDRQAFKNTEVQEGLGQTYPSDVVEAKSRYYNMVTERGYDEFLEGINIEPNKTLGNILLGNKENNAPEVTTVSAFAAIGGLSIGAYFFIKKKKYN